ncbi:Alstrom syndrome protein 1 [Pteropus alecto]|uniref:Alstrom syndrome protein 1 n=1 Tax=Pteropus alecto TaxID=9402 RepID=L5L441_PTEAL|nr:Alstrom syndrome protein 1 [Pteropus alecto]
MEPEDLPWPGELEEEEEEDEEDEEEEVEKEEDEEKAEETETETETNLDEVEVVMVEDDDARELDADLTYESQPLESTDDEEDEEARAWLQAHPSGTLPLPPLPKHRYTDSKRIRSEKILLTGHVWKQSCQDNSRTQISDTNVVSLEDTTHLDSGDDQRTESWHFLPQEIDSSHTLDTTQTRFNVRKEGTEVTDSPSVEEGILTQSENQVKEPNRDLLCSPLLVIQDSFASPDLPLLTCLTQDQEFGPDSLFHESELDFAPLRGIPGKSEDTEWFSRPSEVSEALFQAASEVASDLEGLQGKAESDIFTLGDDTECCSLDENAVVCSKRVAELQREVCDQSDLTDECIELAGFENLLDDLDICDSSLQWQSDLHLPSKEESSFEELVGHSNMDINQSFSSALPPFVPHEPTREFEYHSSDLRMLRVSPEIMPETFIHLAEDNSKGGTTEITQSNLKPGITTIPGDSHIGSHLPLSPEDFPQFVVRSSVENTVGQHTDTLNQQILADGRVTEETPDVSAVPELADQKTGISAVLSSSYSRREKPSVFYPQALRNSNLTEEALRVLAVSGAADQKAGIYTIPPSSYLLGEKHNIFYQQALPDSHTEGALKVSAVLAPVDQKTEKTTVPSTSYSNREKPFVFSQQQLPGSHLTEQTLKVSGFAEPADQTTGIPTVPSTSYLHGEKPHVFYQQTESHFTEEALKVSASPGLADQKSGIPTVTSTSYSHREKPFIFSQQELPDSQLIEQSQQVSAAPVPTEQKTGISTVPSTSYSHGEKLHIFYQQVLTESHLTEQALKVPAALGSAEEKIGVPIVPSTPYSHSEKPSVFYQQESPDSHLTEQPQQISAVSGFTDQKTGVPTVPSTPYSRREKPSVFYQQESPDSHLTELPPQISGVSGFTDQKTDGIPTVTSAPYSHREKPSVFYQQELPDSHLTEQPQQISGVSAFADQKTGVPTITSTPYSHREKRSVFFHQELPHSHLSERALKVPAAPGSAEEKTGVPTVPSTPYSHREKPSVFYQQELPDSHLTEQSQQISAVSGFADQKTGIPTVTSYSHREKPSVFYQQELPDSHLTEQPQQISAVSGFADQKTSGIPTVTSYSHREKPSVFYQQELPDSHLTEQPQQISAVSGFADQKTSGIPTVTSYSHREKPSVFYQQELPDSHLTEQSQQISAVSGFADQKTGIPTVTSSPYSHREKRIVFYQQESPDSHLTEQPQQISAVSGFTDQKTGVPTVPSTPYSRREKPSVFYQQELPDSHLTELPQRISSVSGFTDQKTGAIPTVTSSPYSHREKPSVFYQQELPDSHLTEQPQQISAVSEFADQKIDRIPTVTSSPYSHREKSSVFYQQELPDSHLTEQPQQISAASEFADQKIDRIPTVTSSPYSHREKPSVFYQQELPDSHLTEQPQQISAASEFADQKIDRIPTVTSSPYSHREKPSVFYQQELPDSHLTEQPQQISAASEFADQKIDRIPTVTSSPYSHREKPSVFYQQELPDSHLTEQPQQISAVSGFTDQKTDGIPTVTSAPYSHRENPSVFYQQELPYSHLTEQALKVPSAPGSAEEKTGIPTVPSTPYSHREKPSVSYQQESPDSHLTEQPQQISAVSGFVDQKTGVPTVLSTPYSHREKRIVFYQQESPDNHLTEQPQQISAVSGFADQKTGVPTELSTLYSHREKRIVFYQQKSPDNHLTEQPQQISAVSGFADQKTEVPTELSTPYSHREKPIVFYQQESPDSHLTEQSQQVLTIPGFTELNTGILTGSSGSYSFEGKPHIFYRQALPDSHLTEESLKVSSAPIPGSHLLEEALKVSAVSGPADQKTGLLSELSSFYSPREKSSIFSQQELLHSYLTEETLKISSASGIGDQKTGVPTVPSSSYSLGGKPIIFYQQALPDRHLTEEALNVSASPGPADQKIGIPTITSPSYSLKEKPLIFYPQSLSDRQLTEEVQKVSAVPLPSDQKTRIPLVTSASYSNKEKPIIFYQQASPDSQPTVEALKVSTVPEPGDQNTRKPAVTSAAYSQREKPVISYQQKLPGSHLTEEAPKVSGIPGTADQKTGLPVVPSSFYSYREKPIISYQEELSDLTQTALKVLGISGPGNQKTRIPVVTSTSYSHGEKPVISYQQDLPDPNEDALNALVVPGPVDQKTGIRIVPPSSYSHREGSIFSYQKELPDITEETLEVSTVPGPADQKTAIQIIPSSSYSYKEKGSIFNQQKLPDTTEEALNVFVIPGPADQKTEILAGPSSSYSHKEKPKISTVIGPDDQKTPLLTVFHNSYSQRVKPSIFFKQHLPGRHHGEDILKISSVPEPTDVNSGIPVHLPSSYSHREKSNISYPQELPDKHLTEDVLKISAIPGSVDQTTVLPAATPSFISHREKPNTFSQWDLADRYLTENALKFSRGPGQSDQITGLSTVSPGAYYSHSEKHKLVSDHVQKLIDNLDSPNSSIISNNMSLNSQADGRIVINKPEPSGFDDVGSEEFQYTDNGSKTLKEIRTLLMEAENIALKRCNFPAPLVPFRDVSDISFIQSKKVVCFREPLKTDESNVDLPQRQPFTEESPSNKCIQKNISTQTNLKCQRGIENWEFISSTTVRNPLQEAESKAREGLDETLRHCKAVKSVMRSEPEGCSGTIGNKILIPMMTFIKSDSSSDASSCSWDSNSLESVSDVLLNLLPYASPRTSMTDSREEEGVSESDDGCGSSVDSLAAHVKNLLKCESSLNHAKQILRNAEEEECRVRARAWNLKFNMARDCGYSISELNEDDRRKVEEIKAKLFGHERTTDLSKGLQSPRGIGYKPEAVCSHIIIESHEKGCFRTLTAEQPQLDSHPCVFRSAAPLEMIRGRLSPSSWRTRHFNLSNSLDQSNPHFKVWNSSLEMIRGRRSPSSWRTRHFNLSNSLDQSNPHFKVWNSLRLQSHSPFQNFTADDFKISKGFQMPFREKMDPWLSELEPACVPPEEMDCHSSSQMLPPESMKKFTTSITFSSHRHSKCFSDSSVLKVGVTEGSQCTGASVGVFNSHFTEEQNLPRDLKQEISSPSSFKIISHSPDNAVTILAESSRQGQKLSVEQSHQEEQLLERPGSHSEPSPSTNINKFKEVHFSDNHTLISMGRPSSTLGVKEKSVTITPDLPSHIFLDQRELFEQCKTPYADHHVRKHHSPPPQNQDFVAPNLPCRIFLEKRELYEQSKAPHVDHQMRESHSPLPPGQDHLVLDLPSSIFLEQRQLFEQSKAPGVDHHMRKQYFPLPQDQDYVVENKEQHQPKSYISNINVEAKFNNEVSQSTPSQSTLITSPSTPPSNRKALSCVRITLSPKTPSKLDSGTLDKNLITLDPASKTRMNSEFDFDLQSKSSRSLEPTSKLLTSKPIGQESLDFLGSKSSPDFQVVQSPLPASNTQDLKTIPFQNSQIVTSKQTQVNFSDLEGYSSPEGTAVSADRSLGEIKPSFSAFSGKLSSDAVTQITTESPEKTMFSSEIFINAEDRGRVIPEPSTQKLGKVPVKFASSSSVQQITVPHGTEGAQPSLLPYKPSGSTKMYYVPQLGQIPSSTSGDSKSDTTVESSHSGSNDAIAPDFPAQVLGTRDDDLALTVNIKHKEGIYSKRAVTKASLPMGKKLFQKGKTDAQVQVLITEDENLSEKKQKTEVYSKMAKTKAPQPEEKESLQKDTAGSSRAATTERSAQQDKKIESPSVIKAIKRKEEIHSKRTVPKEAWSEEKESLQIDIEESSCHSEFENTTHSVFKSAKFYFHHPVHLPNDQEFCHESLGRSVFMRHSWKDFFQRHPDKQREHICPPLPCQNEEKTKTDYTRVESLSINVNLENKEVIHPTKSQARNYAKCDKQINDQKKDHKVAPEPTTQHTANLNELWNKYQERQKQQKCPGSSDRKELSLVERLDRLAKLLQNPITHSLLPSESTQDDSRGERDAKESCGRHEQQKNKLQKKKRYKSLEKCHKNIGDLKKNKVLSTQQAGRSDQIKIEQVKFDKYILRKQPDFRYINNTSSDSRPSEDSELLTDTATNILSTTTSPMESDIFTQTDKEVTLQERSSSISTIDTARLIQAFGHERVCLSPRQIKLYSSITDHQRRYIEKRNKNKKKALTTGYPQMSSEHTRRKHIQVAKHMISSDSSSTSSFWSSNSTFCNKQNVHMVNKGVQAGNLELVNGVKKNTRDVGMTFPTPSSSEVRVEEDSDMTSWSEEKIEEKRPLTSCLVDRKLRKNKQSCCEGVSWFVPVENVRTGPKKENLPEFHGPGISWFAPITSTKPWREPLREQNWQGQHMDRSWSPAGPGRGSLKPFVRASLQESLQLHRPDFISRSGERIKRLKLIVQERKLQNMLQSEREALFNTVKEWQSYQDPICPLPKRGFLAAQKDRLIGKKEMIQRSKRIYEQLPEIQKKREEEKRRLEYRSYRLRAQLYKKKVTNQLLGRKVPWD